MTTWCRGTIYKSTAGTYMKYVSDRFFLSRRVELLAGNNNNICRGRIQAHFFYFP